MQSWRAWNAAKLPGRAVNRFVRGWVGERLTIEVHRTACVVTHPPGGERANRALVNAANERLAGARFTEDECWRELYGEPADRADERYVTAAFSTVDGLVSAFGGDGLRRACAALPADADGARCRAGGAVLTPSFGELREEYDAVIHAVAPFYRPGEPRGAWAATLRGAYVAAFDVAAEAALPTIAVPLLGAGARGVDLEDGAALRVAAEAAVGWRRGEAPSPARPLTARFALQTSSAAHALCDALEDAIRADGDGRFEPAPPPPLETERWALGHLKRATAPV